MAIIISLEEEILKEHSKKNTTRIAKYIGNNEDRFNQLTKLFFSNSNIISQRAAWVLSECTDSHPELIKPYLKELVNNLKKPVHDAIKRNSLRILQNMEIPKNLMGALTDICFKFLSSNQEPVAIKVFSMTILYNITLKEPDLKNELKILIEDQMPYASPGFVSRGNKTLKDLK